MRNRIRFELARMRGDEAGLSRFSLSEDAVLERLAGQRLAVVGNARSLGADRKGTEIDASDLVLRLNAAPMPDPASHGSRCDLLATSVPVGSERLSDLDPEMVLWMTPRRGRLTWEMVRREGMFLLPANRQAALAQALGARPSTGLMAIDLALRSPVDEVALYGFDFFASLSLSGTRTAAQVPHDFAAERAWVEKAVKSDARLRIA